jgi:hypothetical protein
MQQLAAKERRKQNELVAAREKGCLNQDAFQDSKSAGRLLDAHENFSRCNRPKYIHFPARLANRR